MSHEVSTYVDSSIFLIKIYLINPYHSKALVLLLLMVFSIFYELLIFAKKSCFAKSTEFSTNGGVQTPLEKTAVKITQEGFLLDKDTLVPV